MRTGHSGRIQLSFQRLAYGWRRRRDELVDPDMMIADLGPAENQVFRLVTLEMPEIPELECRLLAVNGVKPVARNKPEAVSGMAPILPDELYREELMDTRFQPLDGRLEFFVHEQAETTVNVGNLSLGSLKLDARRHMVCLEGTPPIGVALRDTSTFVPRQVYRLDLVDVPIQRLHAVAIGFLILVAQEVDHQIPRERMACSSCEKHVPADPLLTLRMDPTRYLPMQDNPHWLQLSLQDRRMFR